MDVCHEFDKTIAFDPPLELFYEDNDANTHDENKLEKLVKEDCSHEPHLLMVGQHLFFFLKYTISRRIFDAMWFGPMRLTYL